MLKFYYLLMYRYWHPVLEVPDGWITMLEHAGWRKFEFWRVSR